MEQQDFTVLLVDDSQFILKKLGKQIRSKYHLFTAESGEEALKVLHKQEVDLIISDIVMPGMGGLGLLKNCRELYPFIKVIMITSENTAENILFSLKNSAYSYMPKPIDKKTLMVTIDAALQSKGSGFDVIGAHKDWVAIEIPNDLTLIKGKLNFFYSLYNEFFSEEIARQIRVAFDEMVLNAWEHGNKKAPDSKVLVEMIKFKKMLFYRVRDEGEGFNLFGVEHAAINNPEDDPVAHLEKREELGLRDGGLGILMANNIVDEMKYSEKGNELILIKYLEDD
ncbi:response regulator [Candidatus Riflebacteria bacterium]